MTETTSKTIDQPPLAFDWRDMTKVRVRPAEFARLCQVSRQTVSTWIRDGKVTLGPDGRLDPAKAAKQVIDNSDPSRLRARVFKEATEDAASLRRRIAELTARIQQLEAIDAEATLAEKLFLEKVRAAAGMLRAATSDDHCAFMVSAWLEEAYWLATGGDEEEADDEPARAFNEAKGGGD
ncbi:hypothetical protein MASR1M60_30660 [Rhodocyclaceae bacterium]